MSNFSNIGFDVNSDEEFLALVQGIAKASATMKVEEGLYARYSDPSGAELYLQFDNRNEFVGINPYFNGKSLRKVCLQHFVEREDNPLEGGFHAWSNPTVENVPESGEYPFVFMSPAYRAEDVFHLPCTVEIQLTAFAQEIEFFATERDFYAQQTSDINISSQSFVPLRHAAMPGDDYDQGQLIALAFFTGIVKEVNVRRNEWTAEAFLCLLVDTYGGEIDVVADPRLFQTVPVVGGIIQGEFYLTGQFLIDPSKHAYN
ncbi:MAG: hypothetical protein ACK5XN_22510 [Bacteroidota bacterium]|jgi:hypothetical protein